MIIFDLDGTLADCEHRRHFVDPEKNEFYARWNGNDFRRFKNGQFLLDRKFKPDWKAFYEACDQDKPIHSTLGVYKMLRHCNAPIQVWSGRCESVRAKTNTWLLMNGIEDLEILKNLKMRPIGDSTPDDMLKEKWLDEALAQGKQIDFVFDDRPKVVRMWRKRGIFVFNCHQSEEEF